MLGDQLSCPISSRYRPSWIYTALKSMRCFTMQSQPFGRAPNSSRIKMGALQKHPAGRGRNFGILAAHDAGQSDRCVSVTDQKIAVNQFSLQPIQCDELSFAAGLPNHYLTAGHAVKIESMQWLTGFDHHVICHIHHVIHGAKTAGFETMLDPLWTLTNADIFNHHGRVARAEFRINDFNPNRSQALRDFSWRIARAIFQPLARERGEFARHTQDAQTVAAIGCNADFKDPVVFIDPQST